MVAEKEELREDYELSRKYLREIIEDQNFNWSSRIVAIERLMHVNAMYSGGYDPGRSKDEENG